MEEQQPVFYGHKEGFVHRPWSITVFFSIACLLFLLPFAQLKCGSTTLAQNTGIGMVTGAQWKVRSEGWGEEVDSKVKESLQSNKKGLKSKPNIFAILAIGMGLLGIIFSFVQNPHRPLFCLSVGILGAVMLLALMIQQKVAMRSVTGSISQVGSLIKLKFTIWYWISVGCFGFAAWLGYRHHQDELEEKLKGAHDFEFERDQEFVHQHGERGSSGHSSEM